MAIKAIASSASRPSRIIQIHMVLEVAVSFVCVVWLGRVVCVVVVVVVVVEAVPVVCGGDDAPELAFCASAGTAHAAHARLSASRHALKPLKSWPDFIPSSPFRVGSAFIRQDASEHERSSKTLL